MSRIIFSIILEISANFLTCHAFNYSFINIKFFFYFLKNSYISSSFFFTFYSLKFEVCWVVGVYDGELNPWRLEITSSSHIRFRSVHITEFMYRRV